MSRVATFDGLKPVVISIKVGIQKAAVRGPQNPRGHPLRASTF